jgi:uncharacterized protein (TIGR03000 family)
MGSMLRDRPPRNIAALPSRTPCASNSADNAYLEEMLMYSVVLMLAVSGSAHVPDCHWRRSCAPVYYYYSCCGSPVVSDSTASNSSSSNSSSVGDDEPMTADDIKELKALSLTDKDIDELKDAKMSHKKAQEMIAKLKESGGGGETSGGGGTTDEPLMTDDDVKALKALELSDKDIQELKDAKMTHKSAQEMIKKLKGAGGDESRLRRAPATLTVHLPADAVLTIDGRRTTSTSSERTFVTPTLNPGEEFFYTLKAEVVRDGVTLNVTKRAYVRAGSDADVVLDFSTATVAQAR